MKSISQNLSPCGRRIRVPGASFAGVVTLGIELALGADPRRPAPVGVVAPDVGAPSGLARAPASPSVAAPGPVRPGSLDRQSEPGTELAENTGRRIVVSIADRKLAVIEGGRVVKVYSVAVGSRQTPSPTGEFKITSRLASPTWYHPGKVIPPSKANPLGTRWMGLSRAGYGIHGTNVPRSIGHSASHGCIRMRNHDAEELFALVRVGDTVEITLDHESNALAQSLAGSQVVEVKAAQANPAATENLTAVSVVPVAATEAPGAGEYVRAGSGRRRARGCAKSKAASERQLSLKEDWHESLDYDR